MLTPTDIRRLLRDHRLAPSKRFGQNFVIDANTLRKVVRDAGVEPGDLVCEVGPGLGSLTVALREAGARVIAIEIDAGLVRALREVVGSDEGVRIVHADVLHVAFPDVLAEPAVLVSNLPYNVATPVVLHALRSGDFTRLLVMVQKEVGQRWVASVGDPAYGAVSVKIAALAGAAVTGAVSRRAFYPVPNVDSVTVRLEPRHGDLGVPLDELFAVVEDGFRQRRKRLRNALAAPGRPPPAVELALTRAGLTPTARAEELTLAGWVALTAALF